MKTSEALEQVVAGNPFLQFGLAHRLYNLNEMAKLIKPIVEVRLEKPIQKTALVTGLSRLQKNCKRVSPTAMALKVKTWGYKQI